MKRLIAAFTAVALVALGFIVSATPAQAYTVTGYSFWTPSVCVANGSNFLPIGVAAQSWNNQTDLLTLQASNNCVNAGYTPSRRMTITTYSATDGKCFKVTNTEHDSLGRWTNNPIGWININPSYSCTTTDTAVAHYTTQVIGYIMGLMWTNSAGLNSRVMNNTAFSVSNVPYATAYDGNDMDNFYS